MEAILIVEGSGCPENAHNLLMLSMDALAMFSWAIYPQMMALNFFGRPTLFYQTGFVLGVEDENSGLPMQAMDTSVWAGSEHFGEKELGGLDGDPFPPNFMLLGQPSASDWVLDKVKEIQHSVGLSCECFKDQFIALLTAIEDGHTQYSKSGSKKQRVEETYMVVKL